MLRRVAAIVAVVLALTACSPSSSSSTSPSSTSGFGDKPSSGAAPREVGVFQFTMPSGNIGCHMEAEYVRCDIRTKAWEPPPKPADCELDWGSGIVVDSEDVTFECAGDTVLGFADNLRYGDSVRSGDFICESASANVRCWHDPTGHGFTLAREQYTTF